jgi:hypothetical protein
MTSEGADLYFRGFRLDRNGERLFKWPEGTQVNLSPSDFRILEDLVVHTGKVICASGTIERSNRIVLDVGKPALEQVIRRLRRALGDIGPNERRDAEPGTTFPPPIIHTATAGYLIERSEVSERAEAPSADSAAAPLVEAYSRRIADRVRHVYLLGRATPYALSDVFTPTAVVGHRRQLGLQQETVSKHDPVERYLNRARHFGRDVPGAESPSDPDPAGKALTIDEYTRPGAHAVITGAMGVGKSTLMRHVAARVLADGRTPVFLELGALSVDDWRRHAPTSSGFLRLLVDRSAGGLELDADDAERFLQEIERQACVGQVVVLLDGLDELAPTPFYDDLRRSIEELARSRFAESTLLVSCRSQALHLRPLRGLMELEVQLLDEHGIDEFLRRYFKSSPDKVDDFLDDLGTQPGLYDMASVPTLLGTIFDLWSSPETTKFTSKLAIYREIVQRLVITIHQEKGAPRGFRLNDQDGIRRRAFLRELAASRLLSDDAAARHARPYVFTDTEIRERAIPFAQQSKVDGDAFVNDIVHTAALREITVGTYAFAHPSLQEYLVAEVLGERSDAVERIADLAFDPPIANTEVLPMALALTMRQREAFERLAVLPESLDWALLRIRLKALGYITAQSPAFGAGVYEAFGAALRSGRSPWPLLNDAATVTGDARERILGRVRALLMAGRNGEQPAAVTSIAIFAVGFLQARELAPALEQYYASAEQGRCIPTVLSWFGDDGIRRHLLRETLARSFKPALDEALVRRQVFGHSYSRGDQNYRTAGVPLAVSLAVAASRPQRRRRHATDTAVVDDLMLLVDRLELHHPLWSVFTFAADSLTPVRREQLTDRLAAKLADVGTVPAPITDGLSTLGGRRAADVLLSHFGNEDVEFGDTAHVFLATTYPDDARKAGEAALLSDSATVRERADLLLHSIVDRPEWMQSRTPGRAALADSASQVERDADVAPIPDFDVLGPIAADENERLLAILGSREGFSTQAAIALGQRGHPCVASCLTDALGASLYDRAVLFLAALTSPGVAARELALRVVAGGKGVTGSLCATVANGDPLRGSRPELRGLRHFAASLPLSDLHVAVRRTVSDAGCRLVTNGLLHRSRNWEEHERHWKWLLEEPLPELGGYLWERGVFTPHEAVTIVASSPELASVRTARVLLDIAAVGDLETVEKARLAFRRVPAATASDVLTAAVRSSTAPQSATALVCLVDREDAVDIPEPVFELLESSESDDFGVRETALENLVTLASAHRDLSARIFTMALRRASRDDVRRAAIRVAGYYVSSRETLAALEELVRDDSRGGLGIAAREEAQRVRVRLRLHS